MTGLTSDKVTEIRQEFGFNDLPEEKKHPLLKFLSYFWGPIPWMIEAAAILSAAISNWEDFAVILLLLITNAVVGFLQERKAENAIELLKKQLAPNARVLRDGAWQEIPARELVPGDIVHIRLGDIVPADALLGNGKYLLLDESALTGESLPVEKEAGRYGILRIYSPPGRDGCKGHHNRRKYLFWKDCQAGPGKISAKPFSGRYRTDWELSYYSRCRACRHHFYRRTHTV